VLFDPSQFHGSQVSANIFNFTTITIPAGVTVRLSGNVINGPVVWLSQGDVVIEGTVDLSGRRIRIYDYNPYRIRQARMSGLAKVHHHRHVGGGGEGGRVQQRAGDSDEEEEEANRSHRNGSRRITETSTVKGGQWFREDVSTGLPHLDTVIYRSGCRAIYMEQDQLLLHVDDMNDVSLTSS